MPPTVKAIPEGYEGATPYLIIKGAAGALDFYKKAFGATELMRDAGSGRDGRACRDQNRQGHHHARRRISSDELQEPAGLRRVAGERHAVCSGCAIRSSTEQ